MRFVTLVDGVVAEIREVEIKDGTVARSGIEIELDFTVDQDVADLGRADAQRVACEDLLLLLELQARSAKLPVEAPTSMRVPWGAPGTMKGAPSVCNVILNRWRTGRLDSGIVFLSHVFRSGANPTLPRDPDPASAVLYVEQEATFAQTALGDLDVGS